MKPASGRKFPFFRNKDVTRAEQSSGVEAA
jgi:hypothetical protein